METYSTAVTLCDAGAGEIVDPGWSVSGDRPVRAGHRRAGVGGAGFSGLIV